jgi:hypothetical protein
MSEAASFKLPVLDPYIFIHFKVGLVVVPSSYLPTSNMKGIESSIEEQSSSGRTSL